MNQSPSQKTVNGRSSFDGMDFFDALKETLKGHQIRRREWVESSPIYLYEGVLCIRREGIEYNFIISEADMRATDWYII
jgi:hypothetical protein